MKILIDLTSLADNFSGIERFAACISKELIQNSKYNFVLLFKNTIHPMFERYKNLSNIEFITIRGSNKLIFNQIKLLRIVKHIDADWYLFLAFPPPIFLRKKNVISAIHDIGCWDCPDTMKFLSKWYFRVSYKVAVKQSRYIVTVSEFSKKRISEKLHVSDKNLILLYNGIADVFLNFIYDVESARLVRDKYHLPNQYILSLSTIEPRKNLNLLIKAYSILVKEHKICIPLVLAGRKGWKVDNLLKGLDSDVKKQIFFTGFIDDSDLPYIYKEAEFFVFPSKYEGFGIPPIEAMACGTVVLSSDATSLPEILGNSAVYFQSGNIDDLCNKLMKMINKDNLNYNYYLNKMKESIIRYNWNKESDKLLSYLVR